MRSLAGHRYRDVAADLALVTAVVALLAGVHVLLPRSTGAALSFRHDLSRPWTLFTAAYLHADAAHLSRNLLGYALAALYAYALCLAADERRWFRRTFAALLLAAPPLVNLATYAAFAVRYPGFDAASRGFSGVVGGFAGFLLVALYAYVRERFSDRTGRTVAVSAFLLLAIWVDGRYAGGVRLPVAGLAVTGILLLFVGVVDDDGLPARPRPTVRAVAADAAAVGLVCAVLAVLTLGLFPPPEAVVSDGSFTNVFAHASGLLLGIALSAALLYAPRAPAGVRSGGVTPRRDRG